ncbi:MAG TPA: amidase [Xanthobacteraceae bacterium]|nr:amidase [Xanthobacteraceae bacterium]
MSMAERVTAKAEAPTGRKLRPYAAQAAQFRSGKTTPREFLENCLEAIARLEPSVGAFIEMNIERARRDADAASARWRGGKPLSAIDGMPVGIKDIIETADMPTGQGSPLWKGFRTRRDAASVFALREAGAVILGKTSTTEFAASHPWPGTFNPHDRTRSPGGSSSGSAAAVGAGMIPAALGTQVVGSILRPASYCGCVGFKPTVGAINRGGAYDQLSQSVHGSLAASLADAWLVVRAIAERAGGDPGYVGLQGEVNFARRAKPARLALLETGGWKETSDGARKAFEAAKRRLTEAGVVLGSRGDDPLVEAAEREMAEALPLTRRINEWEGRWPLNTYADTDIGKLSALSQERLRNAVNMTQADYAALIAQRERARAAFAKAAERYEAFVTLSATGAAPVGFATTGNPVMNAPASYLGVPAISLPVLADEGLPLGLQLMGGAGRDAALFETAAWVVTALGRSDLIGAGE